MKVGLLVDGGAMTPGPALAQKLGPLGIDIGKVIADVNKATMSFKGTKVPVELDVDTSKKTYTISVSTPPIPELLKKELGAEKGSEDHKNAVKTVVGSCVSIGVLIENKPAKKVAVEVQEGIYDKEIAGEKTEVSPEKRKALDKYFSDIKSKQEALKKKAEEEKALAEQEKTKEAAAKPAETETKETKDASAKTPAGKPAAGKETAKSVAKPAAKKEAKK